MTLRAIIADDEVLSIEMLGVLLSELDPSDGLVDVIATCRTGEETRAACERLKPDLVFLDIQMPGGTGMHVAQWLYSKPGARPRIIFTTAHAEYAAGAFDVDAVDYLLKPIELPRLRRALERARQGMRRTGQRSGKLVPVPVLGGIELVELASIESAEASGDYLTLSTAGRSYMIRKTLSAFAKETYPVLRQTHRSYLVNLASVMKVVPRPKGEALLCLHSGAEIPVSRRHRDVLQDLIS